VVSAKHINVLPHRQSTKDNWLFCGYLAVMALLLHLAVMAQLLHLAVMALLLHLAVMALLLHFFLVVT
jgi:hypothetical protein